MIIVIIIIAAVVHSKRAARRAEAWEGVITDKFRCSKIITFERI
jgi:hypothetical protein